MASPQKENGYTPIANEILEKLAFVYLRPSQTKVLFVLLRKTYGWNKSEDAISLSQFSIQTGLKTQHVCRSLKELINMNLVTKIGNGYITKYKLQKDFDQWKKLPTLVMVLPNSVVGTTKFGNKLLPNSVDTKEIKTIIQKTGEDLFPFLREEAFKTSFADFLKMRVSLKKKTSPRAEKIILSKLHKVSLVDALQMLENAIEKSWLTVYPLKDEFIKQEYKNNKLQGIPST